MSKQVGFWDADQREDDPRREYRHAIALLLDQVGDKAHCPGCGKPIWWVAVRSGKIAPYTQALATVVIPEPPQPSSWGSHSSPLCPGSADDGPV